MILEAQGKTVLLRHARGGHRPVSVRNQKLLGMLPSSLQGHSLWKRPNKFRLKAGPRSSQLVFQIQISDFKNGPRKFRFQTSLFDLPKTPAIEGQGKQHCQAPLILRTLSAGLEFKHRQSTVTQIKSQPGTKGKAKAQ